MYNDVPSGMMNTIHKTAFSLASDIQSGKITMDSLNINNLAQKVMSEIDESELEEFATSLSNDKGGINRMNSMYEMVGNMMGSQMGFLNEQNQ